MRPDTECPFWCPTMIRTCRTDWRVSHGSGSFAPVILGDLAVTLEALRRTTTAPSRRAAAERLGLSSAPETIAAFSRIAPTLPRRRRAHLPWTTPAR